jgi:DnaD/phage-associated family protein
LSALSGGSLELAEPLPPAAGGAAPGIFALYEENIGSITPLIAEELQDAEQRYPPEWLRYAFKEAVSVNKRSWRYVERILRRWETEGPDYEEPERDPRIEWLERRYREGKRRLSARS